MENQEINELWTLCSDILKCQSMYRNYYTNSYISYVVDIIFNEYHFKKTVKDSIVTQVRNRINTLFDNGSIVNCDILGDVILEVLSLEYEKGHISKKRFNPMISHISNRLSIDRNDQELLDSCVKLLIIIDTMDNDIIEYDEELYTKVTNLYRDVMNRVILRRGCYR